MRFEVFLKANTLIHIEARRLFQAVTQRPIESGRLSLMLTSDKIDHRVQRTVLLMPIESGMSFDSSCSKACSAIKLWHGTKLSQPILLEQIVTTWMLLNQISNHKITNCLIRQQLPRASNHLYCTLQTLCVLVCDKRNLCGKVEYGLCWYLFTLLQCYIVLC